MLTFLSLHGDVTNSYQIHNIEKKYSQKKYKVSRKFIVDSIVVDRLESNNL